MSQAAETDPYLSRSGTQWEFADRVDPVVWGPIDEPWTADQTDAYAMDGYRFIEQLLCEDEAHALLEKAGGLAREAEQHDAPHVIIEPDGRRVRSVFRVHRDHPEFAELARDPRILEPVKQLLGGHVYVHQSRINYKPEFDGREFFWHSDFETWHMEDGMPRMRAVSVALNLTENHEFNGPLMVVPRSHSVYLRCVGETPDEHYRRSLRRQEIGVPSPEAMRRLVERGGIVAPKGPAGSAVFFDCNLMHGSAGNLSPFPRTNVFLVYNSTENRLQQPFAGTKPRPFFIAEREPVTLV